MRLVGRRGITGPPLERDHRSRRQGVRQGVRRATLTRKGRVYATGKLPGKLHTRRAVLAGNYTLKVAGKTYPALVA